MHRSRLLVVLIGILAVLTAGTSAASAGGGSGSDQSPQVGRLGSEAWNSGHHTATVVGSYRCWAPPEGQITHLWVSVKQGGPDPTAEGSSATVDAWYDTNVSQDVAVTCDGSWHKRTVTLGRNRQDFTKRDLGRLTNGSAWLQFCLVQGPADDPDGTQSVVASKSRWVEATGFDRHHR